MIMTDYPDFQGMGESFETMGEHPRVEPLLEAKQELHDELEQRRHDLVETIEKNTSRNNAMVIMPAVKEIIDGYEEEVEALINMIPADGILPWGTRKRFQESQREQLAVGDLFDK